MAQKPTVESAAHVHVDISQVCNPFKCDVGPAEASS